MPEWSHKPSQVPTHVSQDTAQRQKEQDRRLGGLERGAPQIIRGKITGATGAIVLGQGFTCTRTAEGKYTIELAFNLPSTGVMVATVAKIIEGGVRVVELGTKVFKVETTNPAMTLLKDIDFTFFIVAS